MEVTCYGGGKKYLKASDVNNGDYVLFIDEGREMTSRTYKYPDTTMAGTPHPLAGQFKVQFEIGVDYKGEEKLLTINKTSFKTLASNWGYETNDWIGKKATITLAPTPNGKKAIYLEPLE
jgi:hypothetical protein